ncbi:MAG: hypothetical protein J0L92_37400 [Deltaproteobacteria bacterium]|nr:hypothetical protein [Deltaproteobacteria bacterium]
MSSRSRLVRSAFCALSVSLLACDPPPAISGTDAGTVTDAHVSLADAGPPSQPDAWAPASPDAFVPPLPVEPRDPALEACWPGRFCWVEGAALVGIDGADERSVHVVDRSGRVYRRDGERWTELPGIEDRRVTRLYVASRDSVWAIAEHADAPGYFVDHFDGTSWTTSWESSDGAFLAGYGETVWVREPGALGWLRHDEDGWRSIRDIDARFGPLREHGGSFGATPMLVPGPEGTLYALTGDVVPMVVRGRSAGDWDWYWELLGPLARGASEIAWSDGEVRAIERNSTGTGTSDTELRFDGVRWTPVRTTDEGRWLVASRSGVQLNVPERWCALELIVDGRTYCNGEALRSIEVTSERETPRWTSIPVPESAARPFSDALFDEVAPAYWAGAFEVVGTAHDRVELPRAEAFPNGNRWVERVVGGSRSSIEIDGAPMLAQHLAGHLGGDLFAGNEGVRRGRRTRDGFAMERVTLPESSWSLFAGVAVTPSVDGAWIGHGPRVLHLIGDEITIDVELPSETFESETQIAAIDASEDDVWVLATIGHRTRRAALFHRELDAAGAITYRRIDLGFSFWDGGQLVRRGETLFIYFDAGWMPGLRSYPIADLVGTTPREDDASYVRRETLPPGVYASAFPAARLWVGAHGPWLTTASGAVWWPE